MSERFLQSLNTYEIFGKSLPGAVFLVGVVSIMPAQSVDADISPTFANLAALSIVLLLAGLAIGQGVHTLADNMEKVIHWIARRIRRFVNYLRVKTKRQIEFDSIRITNVIEQDALLELRIIKGLWNNSMEWFRKRFWGAYDSLVGHRRLLGKSIQWNFSEEEPGEEERWPKGSRGELYELFAEAYENEFGHHIEQKSPPEIERQYPLITSSIPSSNKEYRQFQSIYSFCRSMWVVFFLLSIGYIFLILGPEMYIPIIGFEFTLPEFFSGTPIIVDIVHKEAQVLLPFFTMFATIVFFDAAGTYKRYYVEYLMADFVTSRQSATQNRMRM